MLSIRLLLPQLLLLSRCLVVFGFVATPHYHASITRATTSSSTCLHVDGKGMAGGTQHLVGDVIRALQPRYLDQVKNAMVGNLQGPAELDLSGLVDNAPTWEELKQKKQLPTTNDNNDKKNSAKATERLFGAKEPVMKLYRDSASWCPYCQKVWITLEEKQVPYVVEKVDMRCYGNGKPSEFLALQPNGNLPCAVLLDTNEVISESDHIIDVVDRLGEPGTPVLRPPEAKERMVYLCDDGRYNSLERRLYLSWMWWLTGSRRPEEYKQNYVTLLDELEEALAEESSGPFFLGREISLADIKFIPFMERQIASFAYYKGFEIRDATERPNLVKWLQAMESRPSYQATKSDYYTHSQALPPQISGPMKPDSTAEATAFQSRIDALPRGDAATNNDDNDWMEPGWDWCNNPKDARFEAATNVLNNHENICKFAARSAGTPGFPAASAPLADPSAVSNSEAFSAVDVFLRHIVSSLLGTSNRSSIGAPAAAAAAAANLDQETSVIVADCLDYLRARVGVPRDMSHPAAQELRAELKAISSMLRSKTEAVAQETANATAAVR